MILIHKLLSRIRWDKDFGNDEVQIGYYDRVLDKIIRLPFAEIIFCPNERSLIKFMDCDGVVHSVPLHRIREVLKGGKVIWHRK